jgi:hypothetical protein
VTRPGKGALAPVCGMTNSRNWDGKGDRHSPPVRDCGLRVARAMSVGPEFFRLPSFS